ncbi:BCCT family transporter, partial [Staphylococcus saprophyticus]|uniref:BCCT family transporter n=1 Tax=Staphylococcus saprophyticus TaxID=29385 RepID=UPI0021B21B17
MRAILGDKVDGGIGKMVDIVGVFGRVIGVGVCLGVGGIEINGGLDYLFGVGSNSVVEGIITL